MGLNTPIFVISDLHLGDGGARDNFSLNNRDEELDSFLDFVEKEKGQLIIIGDLFEFWQINLGKILIHRKLLIDRFAKMDAFYIIGNHDCDLEYLIEFNILNHPFFQNMKKTFITEIGGKKFKFMHGHEYDVFNKGSTPGWGRIVTIFVGIFEDKLGSPMLSKKRTIEKTLSQVCNFVFKMWKWMAIHLPSGIKGEFTPRQNPSRIVSMVNLYKQNKEQEGYDIAIVGHTHAAAARDNWYFNSGCWTNKQNTFLKIDEHGDVKLFQWKNGKCFPYKPR